MDLSSLSLRCDVIPPGSLDLAALGASPASASP